MLNQSNYALIQFKTDKNQNLNFISEKQLSKEKWIVKEEGVVKFNLMDPENNWIKRETIYSVGSDWRKIDYYKQENTT